MKKFIFFPLKKKKKRKWEKIKLGKIFYTRKRAFLTLQRTLFELVLSESFESSLSGYGWVQSKNRCSFSFSLNSGTILRAKSCVHVKRGSQVSFTFPFLFFFLMFYCSWLRGQDLGARHYNTRIRMPFSTLYERYVRKSSWSTNKRSS